jgi:membrane protease YdiL (CAAX protease family)
LKRTTGSSGWNVLGEITGITVAGSVLLRLVLTVHPTLFWLAPVLWLYLPLVPLLLRHLPVASHGYSVEHWCRISGYSLLLGFGLLGLYAILVSGWRLLAGEECISHHNALSFQTILVQLTLVAVPEEFFFRGYAHERLRRWACQQGLPQHAMAIVLGAALFALAHVIVLPSWWRMTIFFPGCVMGWLRVHSQGLLVPTLFHWSANLLAFVLHR